MVGAVHTQTIEGFWTIIKRGIVGSFHKVSRKYMPLYVAEFQFRYNLPAYSNRPIAQQRSVDESQEIAVVEVTEAVDIHRRNRFADSRHDLPQRGHFTPSGQRRATR